MADITYTAFAQALAALTITGVTRAVTEPPRQVSTADLPLQFVRLPTGEESARTRDHPGGWLSITCELVIVLEPVQQGTQPVNYAATLAMMDAVSVALRATDLANSRNRWTIRGDWIYLGGETVYWAVVASVSNNHL